jgi:hypothetical protein
MNEMGKTDPYNVVMVDEQRLIFANGRQKKEFSENWWNLVFRRSSFFLPYASFPMAMVFCVAVNKCPFGKVQP